MTPVEETAAELRVLLAKATPGPWRADKQVSNAPGSIEDGERYWCLEGTYAEDDEPFERPIGTVYGDNAVWLEDPEGLGANAEFIVAARNFLPAILDELDRLGRVEAAARELCSEVSWAVERAPCRKTLEELRAALAEVPK